jgi:hypothetical protein
MRGSSHVAEQMIEPSGMSSAPETVVLTIGPAQKVTLDLGHGVVNARRLSDNKVQLKFRTKDFEAERQDQAQWSSNRAVSG